MLKLSVQILVKDNTWDVSIICTNGGRFGVVCIFVCDVVNPKEAVAILSGHQNSSYIRNAFDTRSEARLWAKDIVDEVADQYRQMIRLDSYWVTIDDNGSLLTYDGEPK